MCRIIIYECDDINHISTESVASVISCNLKKDGFMVIKKEEFATEITISHVNSVNSPELHNLPTNQSVNEHPNMENEIFIKSENHIPLVKEEPEDFYSPGPSDEIDTKQEICEEEGFIEKSFQLEPVVPSKLQCPRCNKTYKSSFAFNKHIIGNNHTYNCYLCCQGFDDFDKFQNHMWKHTGENMFKCTICPETFKYRYLLKRHECTHEELNEPSICKICDKKFLNPSGLKIHLKYHRGEMGTVCKYCGKVMYVKHKARYHMAFHCKERPLPVMNKVMNDLALDGQ